MSIEPKPAPSPASNIVLRQLQGIRRELEAVLERQDRTQQLVVRLDQHMETRFQHTEARFQHVETRFAEIRTAIAELRSDGILQENLLLTRHNEILEILRRLDAAEIADGSDVED